MTNRQNVTSYTVYHTLQVNIICETYYLESGDTAYVECIMCVMSHIHHDITYIKIVIELSAAYIFCSLRSVTDTVTLMWCKSVFHLRSSEPGTLVLA